MLPSHKIDQKLILSHSRLPSALSYFMFPFIENIGFTVSRRPPFAERRVASRRFARMHVAAAFFSPRRVAPSLKSMQIFHGVLFAARAFASATHRQEGRGKKRHPSGLTNHSFPAALSPRPFFILSTLPDVAVRETNL